MRSRQSDHFANGRSPKWRGVTGELCIWCELASEASKATIMLTGDPEVPRHQGRLMPLVLASEASKAINMQTGDPGSEEALRAGNALGAS